MKMTASLLTALLLATSAPKDRKAAPDFALKDLTGATVSLSAEKGKVVLLDFWATWCHGCKTEIPWFMEFATKYRDKGLVVIGVSMDDDGWASVSPFMKEQGMNYPVVIGTDDLARRYDVTAMPVTFLIDRNGAIAFVHAGLPQRGKAEIESEIGSLLGVSRSDGFFAPAFEILTRKAERNVEAWDNDQMRLTRHAVIAPVHRVVQVPARGAGRSGHAVSGIARTDPREPDGHGYRAGRG